MLGARASIVQYRLHQIKGIPARLASNRHFVAVVFSLQTFRMVCMMMYLINGIGFTGQILVSLQEVGQLLAILGLPFCIIADWSAPPQKLQQLGWVHQVGGDIVVPTNVTFACRNAAKRMLDY